MCYFLKLIKNCVKFEGNQRGSSWMIGSVDMEWPIEKQPPPPLLPPLQDLGCPLKERHPRSCRSRTINSHLHQTKFNLDGSDIFKTWQRDFISAISTHNNGTGSLLVWGPFFLQWTKGASGNREVPNSSLVQWNVIQAISHDWRCLSVWLWFGFLSGQCNLHCPRVKEILSKPQYCHFFTILFALLIRIESKISGDGLLEISAKIDASSKHLTS